MPDLKVLLSQLSQLASELLRVLTVVTQSPKPVSVVQLAGAIPVSNKSLSPAEARRLARAGYVADKVRPAKITAHFNWGELLHNVSGPDVSKMPDAYFDNLLKLAELLEAVRARLENRPVVVTSGYRTLAMNSNLPGAATGSYHLRGLAADFTVVGLTPAQVYERLEPLLLTQKAGLGKYPYHTHIDARGSKARWVSK